MWGKAHKMALLRILLCVSLIQQLTHEKLSELDALITNINEKK